MWDCWNPQIGLVNSVMRMVGIEGPAWLADKHWAFFSLVMMSLWSVGGG